MSLVGKTLAVGERLPVPDTMARAAMYWLVSRTQQQLDTVPSSATVDFARAMKELPVAAATAVANAQHYEVPTDFFKLVLGPRLKYSCCLFPNGQTNLPEAEDLALAETARHAGLADGQRILELGCGWGSLALWMANHYPNARILAVSNSATQRCHIERQAALRNLSNIKVLTADMNAFTPSDRFDRIVSVEMFEHMSNWPQLLSRIHGWLADDGRLFVHVFAHASSPFHFDAADDRDWIARHFFTGGIMPSHALLGACAELFDIEHEWRWNGQHYARTAKLWRANLDAKAQEVGAVLRKTYGSEAALWQRRWRLFFLATEVLFGFNRGNDWGVSHYRLKVR
jgi:cyclopropane-fatty-acyl-phospholipid synthase